MHKDKSNGPEGLTLFYELAERGLDATLSSSFKDSLSQVSVECTTKKKKKWLNLLLWHLWLFYINSFCDMADCHEWGHCNWTWLVSNLFNLV